MSTWLMSVAPCAWRATYNDNTLLALNHPAA